MDAQRMAYLHQPHTPSGLNPGFSTGKKTFPVFKIPALPQAHLPSVSTSTPLRLGPRLQAASTLDSDNTISGMDYGGLEDKDKSREGAAIPRVMARQRNKESSSKENDHTFEVHSRLHSGRLLTKLRYLTFTSLMGMGSSCGPYRKTMPITTQ